MNTNNMKMMEEDRASDILSEGQVAEDLSDAASGDEGFDDDDGFSEGEHEKRAAAAADREHGVGSQGEEKDDSDNSSSSESDQEEGESDDEGSAAESGLEDNTSDDEGNAKRAKTAKKASNVAAAASSSHRATATGASSEDDGERPLLPPLRTPRRGRRAPKRLPLPEPAVRRTSGASASSKGAVVPAILSEEAQHLRSSIALITASFEDGKLDGLRGRAFQKQCTAWADVKSKAASVAKKLAKYDEAFSTELSEHADQLDKIVAFLKAFARHDKLSVRELGTAWDGVASFSKPSPTKASELISKRVDDQLAFHDGVDKVLNLLSSCTDDLHDVDDSLGSGVHAVDLCLTYLHGPQRVEAFKGISLKVIAKAMPVKLPDGENDVGESVWNSWAATSADMISKAFGTEFERSDAVLNYKALRQSNGNDIAILIDS